jgi:Domain of unknown function (DUF3846)
LGKGLITWEEKSLGKEYLKVVAVEGMALRRETVEHSLESLREQVGGWIETVPLGQGFVAICNEEGMLLDLPVNLLGIHGKALICKAEDGELVSLTDEEQTYIMHRISQDLLARGEY